MDILTIELSDDEGSEYSLKVLCEIAGEEIITELCVSVYGHLNASAKLTYNGVTTSIKTTRFGVQLTPFVTCLLVNGIGTIAYELADCCKRYPMQPLKIANCMVDKGHSMTPDLLKAAAVCAVGIAFPT
ncbi:hypothetical protein M2401_001210 [Pseudomonas sp. JUb42]|jgi:hypothetical protein|uniref:hypothetical protein n=1 Tax=Pseudomonas sp. JUb42 TaxID=2940611 RepID=UPI0021675314|nr:hypothetical protein [Pseudomonas sp. JUb42]MCS3467489.1 hypothetical protein [Pseudomonas sp. JUb42]